MGLVFSSQNWEESRNIRVSIRFFGKMFEKWELSLLVIPHHKKFSASVFCLYPAGLQLLLPEPDQKALCQGQLL